MKKSFSILELVVVISLLALLYTLFLPKNKINYLDELNLLREKFHDISKKLTQSNQENNKLKKLQLINNAFLLSLTGFETYYDQVSGIYIDAYFENNEIQQVHVNQNAESIYFAKDDNEGCINNGRQETASGDSRNIPVESTSTIQRIRMVNRSMRR